MPTNERNRDDRFYRRRRPLVTIEGLLFCVAAGLLVGLCIAAIITHYYR